MTAESDAKRNENSIALRPGEFSREKYSLTIIERRWGSAREIRAAPVPC
jgi:hypothetical protein